MLTLGIDLGTTKTAAVIWDASAGCLSCRTLAHEAGAGCQSVDRILASAEAAIRSLPEAERRQVGMIGITGQMHGVVAWDRTHCSELENWQSTLAVETGTLERIRQIPGAEGLCAGYGFATLAVPGWRRDYRYAATLMDYFAWLLTGGGEPVTEASNAASWGLWNFEHGDWDREAIGKLGIPEGMLPRIVPAGYKVGTLCREWAERLGLPEQVIIKVPIGDNPAAIIGSGGDLENDVFLTIGTGAQIAFLPRKSEIPRCGGLDLRPFPGGRILAISAVLSGGKSIELLANFVGEILEAFSFAVPKEEIYRRIAECSAESGGLQVAPHFAGERGDPSLRGSISGIDMGNWHFAALCRAWHEGVLESLLKPIPREILQCRQRLILNGNAIRKSPVFQQILKEKLPELQIVLPEQCEEAACGVSIQVTD